MKIFAIVVVAAACLCSYSYGQETGEPAANGRPQTRRPYPREITVKDPAGFSELQEKTLYSGPQPGEKLPAFEVVLVDGDAAKKTFDPVATAAGKPLILIFQGDTGVGLRGLLAFARLLQTVKNTTDVDLQTAVVFLGDDPAALSEMSRRIKQYAPDGLLMGISSDGRDGPGAYGLNRNVGMTILLAKDGVVKHNFAMPQAMLTPDPHVLGAVAQLVEIDREKFQTLLSQEQEGRQRMRATR